MDKVIFCWSGGKDSALALYQIIQSKDYSIDALLTTITEDYNRISMHGVRSVLLEQQAQAMDLPLEKVLISKTSSNEEYETKMNSILQEVLKRGTRSVIFGDIFLEDLREYREKNLNKLSMNAVFPLWKKDTWQLAEAFINQGFKAILTCVDMQRLDVNFVGREYNRSLLADLPATVDPCGENGEFHTFVYAGPIFKRAIKIERGDIVMRDERFCFCDLVPVS